MRKMFDLLTRKQSKRILKSRKMAEKVEGKLKVSGIYFAAKLIEN
jgi:hypothetical protein